MSNVAEPSKAGNPVALEVALEDVDTQKQSHHAQWVPVALMDLLADQAASEVVSVVVLTVEEEEEVSEEDSKTEVASAAVVVEEVSDIKEAEAFLGVALVEETVAGMGVLTAAQTDTEHLLLTLQLVQEVEAVVALEAAEVVMEALVHPIEMVLQLMGMIRAEVDAHMKIGTAAIVVVAVTEVMIAMVLHEVEAEATWSR